MAPLPTGAPPLISLGPPPARPAADPPRAAPSAPRRNATMAKALLKRSEMPTDMLWDLQSVYPSDAAWEDAYKAAAAAIPGVARYQGRLGESGAVLLEALRARDMLTNTSRAFCSIPAC